MEALREIDVSDFAGVSWAGQPGPAPQVQWIEVASLRIDDRYQRPISQRGKMQVRRIAERFRWSRFAPLIVAPIEGGLYAVIDGQHRGHAARLRGIKSVPCMVVIVDTAEQAEAFAEINTQQLAVTGAVLHKSRVVAGEHKAVQLQAVCDEAGCRIVTPRAQSELKRGDTFAAATLYKMMESYSEGTLQRALEAIIQVGDGNVGLVRANVVSAYCGLFEGRQDLRDHPGLIDALDDFDLQEAFVSMQRSQLNRGQHRWRLLADEVEAFLGRKLRLPRAAA
ncbi:DUF6551 family protein [Bosea sp. FBZP-16]|uniref:DUF6551 family protein n=1 Tax=Bosea sp. FBZP-16 TaxID=2065382 RepID=UPI000C3043CC|nr:DUF6551 family protein [Bosea sp. FBZP-16]